MVLHRPLSVDSISLLLPDESETETERGRGRGLPSTIIQETPCPNSRVDMLSVIL
jgi:hypothetical protein